MLRRLTDAQIMEICDRREKGWSQPRLAKWFGVSHDTIRYQCAKLGVVAPAHHCISIPVSPETVEALEAQAARRKIPVDYLVQNIVIIVADGLVDAVLDDAEQLDGGA